MSAILGLSRGRIGPWAVASIALTSLAMGRRKFRRGSRAEFWRSLNEGGNNQPEICGLCNGSATIPCGPCSSTGSLPLTGFATRNSVSLSHVVGTQWTAVQAIQGRWRHFRCIGKRGRSAKDAVILLTGTCGPKADRLQLEVPVVELKKRTLWAGGWVTMTDLKRADAAGGAIGPKCSACSGNGCIPCPRCDGLGQVGLGDDW